MGCCNGLGLLASIHAASATFNCCATHTLSLAFQINRTCLLAHARSTARSESAAAPPTYPTTHLHPRLCLYLRLPIRARSPVRPHSLPCFPPQRYEAHIQRLRLEVLRLRTELQGGRALGDCGAASRSAWEGSAGEAPPGACMVLPRGAGGGEGGAAGRMAELQCENEHLRRQLKQVRTRIAAMGLAMRALVSLSPARPPPHTAPPPLPPSRPPTRRPASDRPIQTVPPLSQLLGALTLQRVPSLFSALFP